MPGLWFEQFEVGQTFVHEIRRTVTDMDNMLFSSLTYNPAAIHIDHAYAATTEFGKPLMNSIFTLGLVIGLSIQDTTFGTTVANLGMTDTVFPKPVFAGDTIRAETIVRELRRANRAPGRHRDVRPCRLQPARRRRVQDAARRFDAGETGMKMRSLLFVPGDSDRKFARGKTIGADVLILDLEDSVAPSMKAEARRAVAASLDDRSRATGRSSCGSIRSTPA